MSTSDHLRELIDNQKMSKNALIRKTGIDRSTFYQIIRGKRAATPAQFQNILDVLEPEPTERIRLLEEYERDKVGSDIFEEWQEIKSFLKKLSCISASGYQPEDAPAQPLIREALRQEIAEFDHPQIQVFLPFDLMKQLNICSEVYQIVASCPHDVAFNIVLANTSKDDTTLKTILNSLLEFISIFSAGSAGNNLTICANTISSLNENLISLFPYPYYILCQDQMILINENGTDLKVIKDRNFLRTYHEKFLNIVMRSDNAITSYRTLPVLMRNCASIVKRYAKQSIYYVSHEPCILLTATENQIKNYIDDELILSYRHLLETAGVLEFCSQDGMKQLLERRSIEEIGVNIHFGQEDAATLQKNIEKRIGHNMFILNEATVTLPEGWDFLVFGKDLIFIGPNYHNKYYFSIASRQIAEKFESWLHSRLDTVNADIITTLKF